LPPFGTLADRLDIEKSEEFGRRWKAWRKRLGFPDASAITLLADGAKWIWEEQRKHLHGADGVLDIFPAWQPLSDLSNTLHTDEADIAAWTEQARTVLLESGWSGIDHLLREGAESRSDSQQAAVEDLRSYLANHQHHLHYAERLARGQSIGSGQVEGGCKNLIGRRLKQTGARWRVRRVNRMAGLCSLMDSHQWKTYWELA